MVTITVIFNYYFDYCFHGKKLKIYKTKSREKHLYC